MKPISIAVVEDREQYRQAMKRMFAQKPELFCAGIFGSAEKALEVIPSMIVPDIVLMDIDLPGMSGVEAVGILQKTAPSIEVMMLTILRITTTYFSRSEPEPQDIFSKHRRRRKFSTTSWISRVVVLRCRTVLRER